jgi:Mg2+/citrate symporter
MIPIIGAMLAEKGISLLGELISKGGDKVMEVVAEKTGIDLKSTKDLTPEQTLALKQFEASEAFKRLQLEFDEKKLDLDNIKDARDMQKVALQQEDLFSKRYVYYFSTAWSFFAMVYIAFITFGSIPTTNVRFADTILGFMLGTAVASMFNFFLGSSIGSRKSMDFITGANK